MMKYQRRKPRLTGKDKFYLLLFLFLFCYVIYNVSIHYATDHYLGKESLLVKGVIIDYKNPRAQNVGRSFSYSYRFYVNGKAYTNDSHNEGLQIGDSVMIEYVPKWPSLNRLRKNNE